MSSLLELLRLFGLGLDFEKARLESKSVFISKVSDK